MKKIISNIRKNTLILLSLATIGSGTLTSCGDFLEIESLEEITLERFWNEKNDVEQIIAGCYSQMQSYGMVSRMLIWGDFRAENISNNGTIRDDSHLELLLKEQINASNVYTGWNEFYDVINRCNTVMKYAPQVAAKDPAYSESELAAHIAEVTALRSLCYFYLIRTFRDVPYSEEAYLDDNQTMKIAASKFDDVLDKLIASLEKVKADAVGTYPTSSSLGGYYQTGRITRLAIKAMLCEMYLWKKDYDKCITYAEEIIEQKKIDEKKGMASGAIVYPELEGYPLYSCKKNDNKSYGNAFNNIFVSGNSKEGIFELTFVRGSDTRLASNGPINTFFANATDASGFVKPSAFLTSNIKSTNPTIFGKYDGRAFENIRFDGAGNAGSINKFTTETGLTLGDRDANDFFGKGSWGLLYAKDRNKSNVIIYRLTDIMLLEAEALCQKISDAEQLSDKDIEYLDKAFQLVNVVNKRSIYRPSADDYMLQKANYMSKGKITDLVYDERNRELMFEGKRYYDLVRRSQRDGNTDYLVSKVTQKCDNIDVVRNLLKRMDAIYWPYNISELRVNPYLIQNPAFGSGENGSFDKNN